MKSKDKQTRRSSLSRSSGANASKRSVVSSLEQIHDYLALGIMSDDAVGGNGYVLAAQQEVMRLIGKLELAGAARETPSNYDN